MYQQPAYVNLVGCWLLTFLLCTGKLATLTEMSWWWAVSPVLTSNGIFAGRAVLRVLLMRGVEDED